MCRKYRSTNSRSCCDQPAGTLAPAASSLGWSKNCSWTSPKTLTSSPPTRAVSRKP
jgi:hypothetical protein